MTWLFLILGLIMFVLLVVVHEWGHFIVSRRNGVEVEEFSIGFPPRVYGRKFKNDPTLYSISLLPLGGFVKLKGEHDADTTKGSYGAATTKTKVKIMLAGVGMNLLTAFLLLTIIALVGMPKLLDNQFTVSSDTKITKNTVVVSYVEPGSPAEKAGIKLNDKLIQSESLQGCGAGQVDCRLTFAISNSDALRESTHAFAGQLVRITVQRDDALKTVEAQLRTDSEVEASKTADNPKGYLGVVPQDFQLRRSTWSAPIVAGGVIKEFTVATLKGLWSAVRGLGSTIAGAVTGNKAARQSGQTKASEQVSGPVGIYFVLKQSGTFGYQFLLMIIAVLSLTLAIMNVLPIPALDGGRLFVTLLFRAAKKPLNQKLEERIHGTGFALLMGLFVLITMVDIKRFF
jgi:regulator of sigma E protease